MICVYPIPPLNHELDLFVPLLTDASTTNKIGQLGIFIYVIQNKALCRFKRCSSTIIFSETEYRSVRGDVGFIGF